MTIPTAHPTAAARDLTGPRTGHPAQPTIDHLLRLSEQAWERGDRIEYGELSARAYALRDAADMGLWEERLSARERRMVVVWPTVTPARLVKRVPSRPASQSEDRT